MTTTINASTTYGIVQTADGSGILQLQSNGTSAAGVSGSNFQCNSGYGSVATAYGCRAWVNFDGTGTVAIRASGNVSSITDNGTGDYTVNFTSAMPDANYSVVGATKLTDSTTTTNNTIIVGPFSYATTSVRVYTTRPGDSLNDCAIINISIFR